MFRILSLVICLGLLSACGGLKSERNYKDYHPDVGEDRRNAKMKSIITQNDEPIVIYGDKKNSQNSNGSGMAGSYLWKAALESISFMPLVSSDSNGGAIITDWYADPSTPNEQFKFNIFILSSELQVTSIKVTAFKQVRQNGSWHSAHVSKDLAKNIEENILKKAIALRVKTGKTK